MYKLKGGILFKDKKIIGAITNSKMMIGRRDTTYDHSPLDERFPAPTHRSYERDLTKDEMTLTLHVSGIHPDLVKNLYGGNGKC